MWGVTYIWAGKMFVIKNLLAQTFCDIATYDMNDDRTIYIKTPASSSFCVIITAGSVYVWASKSVWCNRYFVEHLFCVTIFFPEYIGLGLVLRGACARIVYIILQGCVCVTYVIFILRVFFFLIYRKRTSSTSDTWFENIIRMCKCENSEGFGFGLENQNPENFRYV